MKKILLFLFLAIIGSVIYLRGSEKVPVFNGEKIYAFDLDMGKVKK